MIAWSELFLAKVAVDEATGCWLWTASRQSSGYGQFCINRRPTGAHRASWLLHRGPIQKGLFVLHRCDVKLCVNPDHLFLGTQADNVADMCRKGRRAINYIIGTANGAAKIDEQLAKEIRARYAKGGVYQYELAEEYGLVQSTVSAVVRRENWRHVA